VARPYNVNVGVIQLGEWPSSVPAAAEIEVRVGHASELSDTDVLHDVRALVAEVLQTAGNPKFEIALHGFKAQGYYLSKDHPMVGQMATAHAAMHGAETSTEVLGSTTDARYYLNQLNVPALCFGPVVKNMHGSDERVELASIEKGAATLARFIATYFEES
jgi:acetylornithine deacetylase